MRYCRSSLVSLADVRVLLELKSNPSAGCQGINELLDHHIERVHTQMEALRTLEMLLTTLRYESRLSSSMTH